MSKTRTTTASLDAAAATAETCQDIDAITGALIAGDRKRARAIIDKPRKRGRPKLRPEQQSQPERDRAGVRELMRAGHSRSEAVAEVARRRNVEYGTVERNTRGLAGE